MEDQVVLLHPHPTMPHSCSGGPPPRPADDPSCMPACDAQSCPASPNTHAQALPQCVLRTWWNLLCPGSADHHSLRCSTPDASATTTGCSSGVGHSWPACPRLTPGCTGSKSIEIDCRAAKGLCASMNPQHPAPNPRSNAALAAIGVSFQSQTSRLRLLPQHTCAAHHGVGTGCSGTTAQPCPAMHTRCGAWGGS
jgi:hypothetical protein